MGNIIVSPPNKAAVVSGPRGSRIAVGSCIFQWWLIETTNWLSLEIMTLPIHSKAAETTKGVRVNVSSIAQIKVRVKSDVAVGGADGGVDLEKINTKCIMLAAQHFLGDSEANIRTAIQQTMEGHQRQILGTMTVEEIYKDRAAFSEKLREHVNADLGAMGFCLVSYTITNIDDDTGYMLALGQTQTAMVKREAAEGTARNEAEARKKVAQYKSEADIASAEAVREAHVSVNQQREAEAESDRDLNIKRAEFATQVNEKNQQAEAATRIERAKQDQVVVRETTQQENERAIIRLQIADNEVARVQKEKEGESLADLMEQKNRAEAIRVMADANAMQIKAIGDAEAAAIEAKGNAEAKVLHEKAEAFKQYGEAALVQMIVEKLPEIAGKMAAPLAKTEKMIFVSSDGSSASKLTGDVARMMAQLPDVVQGITGVDINAALKKFTVPAAGALMASQMAK